MIPASTPGTWVGRARDRVDHYRRVTLYIGSARSLIAALAVFVVLVVADIGLVVALVTAVVLEVVWLTSGEWRHVSVAWHLWQWPSIAVEADLGVDSIAGRQPLTTTAEGGVLHRRVDVVQHLTPEVLRLRVLPDRRVYRLRVDRLTFAEFEKAIARLCVVMRVETVTVRRVRSGIVELTAITADPLRDPPVWVEGEPVAYLADGRGYRWQVGAGHALVAGTTGSGKSSWLRVILADLCGRPDVELWLVDLKRVELAAFARRATRMATSPNEATRLLDELAGEVESRYDHLARVRRREWLATDGHRIVCVIDEAALLVDVDSLEKVAAIGRAAGVELILSTQQASVQALGSSVLRSNLPRRIGCRALSTSDAEMIMGATVDPSPAHLPSDRPGLAVVLDPILGGPTLARCRWIDEHDAEQIARRHIQPAHDPSVSAQPVQPTSRAGVRESSTRHRQRVTTSPIEPTASPPQSRPTTRPAPVPDITARPTVTRLTALDERAPNVVYLADRRNVL